jgi:hypothetical protein
MNAELRSPRAHVHHLTSLRRRLLVYLGGTVIAMLGLYLLVAQLVASVVVQVAGVNLLPETDQQSITKAVDAYYSARPTERLRFLLNEPELLAHLQASHPEMKSMRIEQGGTFGEASVTLVARRPLARWSLSGSNQYVDGEGIVFARNYYSDPQLQIVDNSGLGSSTNRLVASNRFLGFVGRVIAGSTTNGLAVDKVTIPALTTRQIALKLVGEATEYKLSVDRSAGQQVEDIARIDKYLSARNMKPSYVDVRISGKAFYR